MEEAKNSAQHRYTPEMHLVITNISKRANVRRLLQTAAAMRCASVLVVGQRSFDFSPDGKDLPPCLHQCVRAGILPIRRFPSWEDCVSHLKQNQIRLVGVEIHQDARPIEAFFDDRHTAFLMGNEGDGLNAKQMKSCDAFVRIPQYGEGTASLNVYVAASIVLHRFHHWQRRNSNTTVPSTTVND
jgi:tRNA G18 (ribose-2'-O)-methylase SpoU